MTVVDLAAGDRGVLDAAIDAYAFKPYRDYRVWSRARQTAMLAAEVDHILATKGHVAVLAAADPAVVGLARPLAWDSAFFGVSMARLDFVLRGGDAVAPGVLDATIQALLDRLRASGVRHVAARADVADMALVFALEQAGFRLMDALVTYFTHPRREPPREVRDFGRIRPFEPRDEPEVLAITAEAYRGYRGRFQLDRHLPRERSDALYLEWARACCAGRMADCVVVADDGHGGLLGWASTRRVEPASSAGGKTVWIGSLGACRHERPGAYAGLLRTLALANYEAGGVTETQTQNHNIAAVRVYDAVGARYVRGEYTFHAWLK